MYSYVTCSLFSNYCIKNCIWTLRIVLLAIYNNFLHDWKKLDNSVGLDSSSHVACLPYRSSIMRKTFHDEHLCHSKDILSRNVHHIYLKEVHLTSKQSFFQRTYQKERGRSRENCGSILLVSFEKQTSNFLVVVIIPNYAFTILALDIDECF